MPQIIEVPGMGPVEFPDGMSEAEIVAAIRRNMPRQAQEQMPAAEVPGVGQTLLIGAGRTVDRIGKGMQQLYHAARGDDAALADLKSRAQEDDRLYAPLKQARPFATGIGEAAPSMVLPGGGAATLWGNVGRMAAAGAAPGLLEYGDAGERLSRGALGAAAGAAVPAAVILGKTGKALAEPLYSGGRATIAGRTLNRVAGDAAPAVRQRLQNAQSLVPGSNPTAAEVAESGGIAALQRSASAVNPEPYTQRAMEQASARLSALRGIAGDDATMAAAVRARDAASRPLYDVADAGVAPVDRFFEGLMARPQFAGAVKRAQELAKGDGLDDIFFRGADGKPQALLGEGAHYIKKALDEAGEFGSTSYTGKKAAESAGATNRLFQDWLSKSIPEYGQARDAFAKASQPINQMEIGRELLDRVTPALSDYGALGKETAAQYTRALRAGDQTAARATGMSGARMADVLSPQQMATVENVARDLARKANAQDLGRGVGSDTFQKLAMENIAAQSGMPRAVGGLLSLPGVQRATGWAYRDSDDQIRGLLADAMLDPKQAAKLMDKASKRTLANNPRARQLLEQAAMRSVALGLLAQSPE